MRRSLAASACAATLLLPLPLVAQTAEEEARDRSFLSDLIEGAISTEGQIVRIDGFRGALSSNASVARLSIADADGEWLIARDLELDWTRGALFDGRLEVNRLRAGSIELIRAPEGDAPPPSPEAVPFALPSLPVSVNVGEIAADRIVLGAALIGQEVVLALEGSAQLAGGEGRAELTATRSDGPVGRFAFSGGFSNTSRVLDIDLDLTEGPGGIASTLLGLPGDPSVALTVQGTAPIDSYDSELVLATDGIERVTGQFQLGTTPVEGGGSERVFTLNLDGDVTPLMAPDYHDFFGEEVALRVTGRSEADGAFELVDLDIAAQAVRLQGAGRIGADGWPEVFRLTGDLGLADGSPVQLPVSGDGLTVRGMDLDIGFDAASGYVWTGRFTLQDLAGSGYLVPDLQLEGGGLIVPASAAAPTGFSVDMTYQAAGLVLDDPALAQAVGSEVAGDIRLSAGETGPVQIEGLTLQSEGLALDLSGTVGAAVDGLPYDLTLAVQSEALSRFRLLSGLDLGGTADLDLTLQGEALNRSFRLGIDGQTRDLTLGIAQADAVLGGAGDLALGVVRDARGLRVESLGMTTSALDLSGSMTLTSGDSAGNFTLVLDQTGRVLPGIDGPANVTGWFLNGAESGLQVQASAGLPGAQSQFTATRATGSEDIALDLQATIPALAAFAEAAGLDLAGSADLTVTGSSGPQGLALTLAARTTALAIGQAQADLLLAGDGQVDARILRDPAGRLELRDLQIETARLSGRGNAVLDGGRTDADLDLRITETAGLAAGLSGPATLAGTVTRMDTGDTTLSLDAGTMGATALVEGMLNAAGLFQGRAELGAEDLGTLSALTGQQLSGGLRLIGTGSLSTDLSELDIALSGETSDLDAGVAAIRPLLAGQGVFAGTIRREAGAEVLLDAVSLATPGLRLGVTGRTDGAAGVADLSLTLPQVALILPGLDGAGSAQGRVTRASAGDLSLDLIATLPGTEARLTAASEGSDPMAGMTGALQVAARDIAPFSRLAGQALSGAVTLNAEGRVVPATGALDLDITGSTTNLGTGNATVARLLAGTGTVAAQISRDAQGLLLARDLDVTYPNFSVSGSAEGSGSTAEARFDASLRDVGLFAPDFSGPATASGTARLSGGSWTVDAGLTGPGGTNANVSGSIIPGGTMNLAASGSAPLGFANGFIEPRRVTGTAGFDLRLNGAPAVENIAGTVSLSGAEITDPTLGIRIMDLGGSIGLSGGRTTLDLAAAVEEGGRLSLSGGLGLTPPLESDLTLALNGVALRDPQLYETTANGAIRISGPLSGGALIAGTVTLGTTEVQIPSSGVGGLGDLPVVHHIGAPRDVARTLSNAGLTTSGTAPAAGGNSARPFGLDILISAPSRIFIRGRGLDAELGGELRIGGTTAQILPAGGFELIRGRLDILQQRFVLTEGRADIQGDFIPWLRLVAETEARTGTMVSIIVEGPANEPEVRFTSSPELPQDEVLAQLLFGQDLTSITPLQAVQLAAAVGTLAGRGGGGVIAGLRTGLGVDDLDLVTDADGGYGLRIGTYLTENVYTDVTIGQNETAVNLNLDLTRDVTVTGSFNTEGETSLGIYYERDY